MFFFVWLYFIFFGQQTLSHLYCLPLSDSLPYCLGKRLENNADIKIWMIRIILIIPHPMCCTLDFSNINDCKSAATTFQIQSLTMLHKCSSILVGYDSILQCNIQQQSTELLPYQSKFQPFHPTLLPLHKFIINYSTMTPTVKKNFQKGHSTVKANPHHCSATRNYPSA